MKISKLMQKLDDYRKAHGDQEIYLEDMDGNYRDIRDVQCVDSKHGGFEEHALIKVEPEDWEKE